jgi:hypothetical protein
MQIQTPDLLKRHGYITEAEYCETFAITKQTAANQRCAGVGPRYVKRGRTVLYPEDGILEWLESGVRR